MRTLLKGKLHQLESHSLDRSDIVPLGSSVPLADIKLSMEEHYICKWVEISAKMSAEICSVTDTDMRDL